MVPATSQWQSIGRDEMLHYAALTLFAERARAVRPDFNLNTENIQAVASICARLDGLPLAIELIAARLRLMSPPALLERLNAQFVLAADGMRAVSARQKTLQGAIGWSYDLLAAEEQRLFARLSVYSGGFTLDAAESTFTQTITNKPVSDLITSLLDKSLLQRTYDMRGELRFDMLVTIQQFALDRLRRTGEEAEARNWHLAYFLDLAEQADKEIHSPDQVKWLDRLEIEHDNFCAALEWCVAEQNTEIGLRLLSALGGSWIGRNRHGEIRSWFDKICALPQIGDYPALYGRLLNHLGRVNWLVGDYREARSVLEEGQDLWLQMGMAGERRLAEALVFLGMVARSYEADYKAAQVFFDRSFELYQQHGDQWGVAFALFNLGINAAGRNDAVSALALLGRSLELFRQLGDLWGIARVSQSIGEQFLRQGKHEKARLYFEQHLMIDEGLHFRTGTVVALGNLGELYRHQGVDDRAIEFYEKSLVMSREYGLKGDWNFAVYSLGMIALHQNDYPLARQRFTDYFKLARTSYEKLSACDLLTGLASVAAGTSQPERAAKLHGAAQEIFETTDYQIPPFNRAEFDRHMEIAREQLGEERCAALQAEGRALTLEQAIELALQETN